MSGRHRRGRQTRLASTLCLLLTAGLSTGGLMLFGATPAVGSDSVTRSETLTRVHLINGSDQVVDTRNFSVTVGSTTRLRDRQPIDVSWQGAHPTGGITGDQQSPVAADEEYPVVIMECRGVDSATAPVTERLSPQTCWTHAAKERGGFTSDDVFPPFRLDRYATATERKAIVGAPTPVPPKCLANASFGSYIQDWVPFVAADGHTYFGGPPGPNDDPETKDGGCAGLPPEAVASAASVLQPSNTTYGVTGVDGTGSTQFVVDSAESNASLGCSSVVPCSLVIIPIMGISCDPAATSLPAADRPPRAFQQRAIAECTDKGQYAPGSQSSHSVQDALEDDEGAVTGRLWWSPSNWRNHLSVPLSFAPGDNLCDVLSRSAPSYVYGSETLVQATTQWAPHFCLNPKLFRFQHVQTGEPAAKNLVNLGSVAAAFVESPPDAGFSRPVVQAPVAVTGFGVAFSIDDAHHKPVSRLNLTPRLLAKLLTESYASNSTVKSEYSTKIGDTTYDTLRNNPLDIGADPEFVALNPGLPELALYPEAAATLYTIASDSDVISALTSYINADPDARAWLDGAPDPWGMTVNPHYKGIQLPVDSWPLLDDAKPPSLYGQNNPCLGSSPVPWLPQVAAPVQSMRQVALNLQFDIANSQITCYNAGQPNQKLVAIGREPIGQRFILGVVPLGDAERYGLKMAALLTHRAVDAPSVFTDLAGRTFVAPTLQSLRAAARLLQPDAEAHTWRLPYGRLRTTSDGADAYPGTLLVSADIATTGVPAADAKHYAEFLRFAATDGQNPGLGNGLLPPGFLPMTSANGLGALAAYTQRAAAAVAAQDGSIPSLTAPTGSNGQGGSSPRSGGGTPPRQQASTPAISGSSSGALPPVRSISSPPASARSPIVAVTGVGYTRAIAAGAGAFVLPIIALVVLVAATASGALWLLTSRQSGR